MRITLVALKRGRIPGKINMGKHQVPHIFSSRQREFLVKKLKIELENEMWLTRPYLTAKQEEYLPNGTRFTAAELRWKQTEEKHSEEEIREFENLRYRIKMPPNITLEERWEPLHTVDKWQEEKKEHKKVMRFQKYSDMAQIKVLPERWPLPEEKWDKWKKVRGIQPDSPSFKKPYIEDE